MAERKTPQKRSSPDWEQALAYAKAFFRSGLFYILLGGLLMYFGYRLSRDPFTHSAFVFLVVILGVALLLFGTGTSASGEGTSGTIKVAIAGGAGVLAMVLGFGVAYFRTDLTEVFNRQRDYGIVEISVDKPKSVPIDLDNFEAHASWGGTPLPLWKSKQRVEETADEAEADRGGKKTEDRRHALDNAISVELTPKQNFSAYTVDVEDPMPLDWSGSVRRLGFNNELLEVIKKTVRQVSNPQPVPASEASTRKAQPLPPEIQNSLPGVN
jgi:hypothetical protein